MTCIICNNEILLTELTFFWAFEVPYVNFIVHRDCYKSIDPEDFAKVNKEMIISEAKEKDARKSTRKQSNNF